MATQKLIPLEIFDARILQTPLRGLLRNMDGELGRRHTQAMGSTDRQAERNVSLFLMMLRFTQNSFEAISFLCSDEDDAPKRKREFALLLSPTNRQLLDLLFTLVYMLDDFPGRSVDYELSGYRQLREEYEKHHARYGTDPKWQTRLADMREFQQRMETYWSITPAQKANPATISYWYAPYRLMKQPTKSQPFLQHLERWLYGETSAVNRTPGTKNHKNLAVMLVIAPKWLSPSEPWQPPPEPSVPNQDLTKILTLVAFFGVTDVNCPLCFH